MTFCLMPFPCTDMFYVSVSRSADLFSEEETIRCNIVFIVSNRIFVQACITQGMFVYLTAREVVKANLLH